MVAVIVYDRLVRMLRQAAAEVRANESELSRLDSRGGDGDHGTTMVRAVAKLEHAIDVAPGDDPSVLLRDVGWAILGVDGGATGPLFGSFFLAMAGEAPSAGPIDVETWVRMLEAGRAGVCKNTRAGVGDKTLVDALVPAVMAARAAAQSGWDVVAVLSACAEAAHSGAQATTDLVARFGRAKNVGEKSRGTQDPGATSVSLIFRGFLRGACSDD